MPHLDIKIVSKNDTFTFAEAEGKEIFKGSDVQLTHAAIIQGGMQSGKTSVMFGITYEDQFVLVETSAGIIDYLYHAIKGAEQRWKE
jgi:hypothetical protein